MRWPFRRKDDTPESDVASGPAVSGAVPAPSESAPRRSSHHWATLPPLPVIVNPSAPLVMGPAPVLEPLPGTRRTSGAPIAPATGRVEGLVHPLPAVPEPPARAGESPAAVVQPPLVHRPVQSGPPTPVSSLTDAIGSYVGEPREPAEPYRAPGWLRYVPEWLQQGGTSSADLGLGSDLPMSRPEPPRPVPAPVAPPPVLPQRLSEESAQPEAAAEESTADTPSITSAGRPRRRPNLGQTRRLGLGAPLKRGPDQDLVLPSEPTRFEQTQAPQAIETHAEAAPTPLAEPAPASGPAQSGDDTAEDVPEPPPAPPPQPPPLVHRPVPDARAGEPAETDEEPVRPSPSVAGPVVPSGGPTPSVRPTPSGPPPPASSVPLVYRAAPPKPEQAAKPVTRRATPVQVPTSLASAIRGSHGVDVGDVLVHRGPEVSTEARSLGARAFTRDAEVFLPEDAGSLDAPKARGLLAHELVHVVQQRTLGGSLPALSTSAGAALEAEAIAAEHEHTGHGGHSGHSGHSEPSAPLVHPVLTQVLSQAARTAGIQLAPLESMSFSSPTPAVSATSALPSTSEATSLSEPVRQEIDQISEFRAIRVFEQWTNPALGGSGFSSGDAVQQPFPTTIPDISSPATLPGGAGSEQAGGAAGAGSAEAEMANQVLQVVNMDRAANGQPGLAALDASTMEQIRRTIAEQNEVSSRRAMMFSSATAASTQSSLLEEFQANQNGQQSDPNGSAPESQQDSEPSAADYISEPSQPQPETATPENTALRDGHIDIEKIDLDELSTRLYDRLRSRLRLELLIDRERAGLLSDFR